MAILFQDNFTGGGGAYGRFADTVNCFSPDMCWSEDMDKGYVSGGFLRASEGYFGDTYRVWISPSSWTTVAEYDGAETLDVATDPHDVTITVRAMDGADHTVVLTGFVGALGPQEISVGPSHGGLSKTVTIQITDGAGAASYELNYDQETGIDMFAITTPGHAFVEPERGKTWTRHMKTVEVDA